jgi:cytochrome P450
MRAPGPDLPAVVQTMMYLARPEEYLTSCHRKYGDVFAIETVIFGKEVCIVRPEMIKTVFTSDPNDVRAGEANVALEPLVGHKSVLLLDGAEHLRQRRLLMPPFHGERMRDYAAAMREITTAAVDAWPRGKPLTLHPEMQKITLDVILRTIFGADDALADELRVRLANLLEHLSSPLSMIGTVPAMRKEVFGLSPWARFRRAVEHTDELIFRQIAKRRREKSDGKASRTDVLSMLLDARDEDGKPMSDRELRDELMTLLVAGHETTATELAWAFDLILRDERVLSRVKAESAEHERAPYTDAAIKEVLRLRPVIPAVGRVTHAPLTLGSFEIPVGTLVVPGVWLTHRLGDVYDDAATFRPERFLDSKPDPYAWLPFGGGIRRCIGMAFALFEMRVVLSTILSRVRLELVEKEPARVQLRGFTHAPRGGVQVIVRDVARSIPVNATRADGATAQVA